MPHLKKRHTHLSARMIESRLRISLILAADSCEHRIAMLRRVTLMTSAGNLPFSLHTKGPVQAHAPHPARRRFCWRSPPVSLHEACSTRIYTSTSIYMLHINTYTYKTIHTCVHIYIYLHVYICVCLYIYANLLKSVYIYSHIHTYICMHAYVYIYMYVYLYIHIYIQKHINILYTYLMYVYLYM